MTDTWRDQHSTFDTRHSIEYRITNSHKDHHRTRRTGFSIIRWPNYAHLSLPSAPSSSPKEVGSVSSLRDRYRHDRGTNSAPDREKNVLLGENCWGAKETVVLLEREEAVGSFSGLWVGRVQRLPATHSAGSAKLRMSALVVGGSSVRCWHCWCVMDGLV